MEFWEVIQNRYSVRHYRSDPVEDWKLQQVLEAARMAPTACNRQAFRILVIHTRGREPELGRIYAKEWFIQAPIVICACGLPSETWVRRDGKNYHDVDVAIVFDHLILAAANLGLGTCWVANFDPDATREVLGLPPEAEPLAFTPLGYPADQRGEVRRRELAQLVCYERWS